MKIKLLTLLLSFSLFSFAQTDSYTKDIVQLASIYDTFTKITDSTLTASAEIQSITSPNLKVAKDFIIELKKKNSAILTSKFLTKPDTASLKSIYIIRAVHYNKFEKEPKDELAVIDSLVKEQTNYYELLSCYYGFIFSSVTQSGGDSFDLSNVNFTPADYKLENETEKAIFFLEGMERFGMLIWGYIHIAKPPNYEKALVLVNKYPTYNGEAYYKYINLDIDDFLVKKDRDHPKESYKKYYLNKYMNTVLYHVLCLAQKPEYEDEKLDVLLNSILRNEMYWEYSENAEILDQIYNRR